MRYHKTAKARETLVRNGPDLSQAERRILILCDGKRDRDTLLKMLGADAAASVEVLLAQGYLEADSPAAHGASNSGRLRVFGSKPAPAEPIEAASPIAPLASPAPIAADTPASDAGTPRPSHAVQKPLGTRRSISAAKMYMLDMLQLHRSLEASSLAVSIQTSSSEGHLVWTLLDGLDHLRTAIKPSLCERIAERLREVLPEHYLDAFHARWNDWQDAAPRDEQGEATSNVIPMERYA